MSAKRHRDPGALPILGTPVNFQTSVPTRTSPPRNLIEPDVEMLLNDAGIPIEPRNGSLQLQSAPAALRLFESTWRHLGYDSNMWLQWLTGLERSH